MNYLIYQEAIEKLVCKGLLQRLNEERCDFPYFSSNLFDEFDASWVLDYFEEEGMRKYARFPFGHSFDLSSLEGEQNWFFNGQERLLSTLDKDILSGYIAAHFLKPEELWNFEKFGFEEPSQMLGVLGGQIINNQNRRENSLPWETIRTDGRTIETVITGSEHYDLRIIQTDRTEYEHKDVFGARSLFRPLDPDYDQSCLAGYHSTEGTFLVLLLKYAEEIHHPLDLCSLTEFGNSLQQRGGGCTEHFGGFDVRPQNFFISYDLPLWKKIDGDFEGRPRYSITTASQNRYVSFIEDKKLHFAYKGEKMEKNATITLFPEDIFPAIKGLLAQSASGLGRTSVHQLRTILDFYQSSDFENYEFR